ncbi:hypothetical protein ACWCPD_16170 [Streptomyces sp. NPDC001935]
MERTDQNAQQPTPHTARDCHLCACLRHPALAQQGRALKTHLADNPFPRQVVTA